MALTSAVIGNAWYQKKQFYPAVVYITKSNASMAVSCGRAANQQPGGRQAGGLQYGRRYTPR